MKGEGGGSLGYRSGCERRDYFWPKLLKITGDQIRTAVRKPSQLMTVSRKTNGQMISAKNQPTRYEAVIFDDKGNFPSARMKFATFGIPGQKMTVEHRHRDLNEYVGFETRLQLSECRRDIVASLFVINSQALRRSAWHGGLFSSFH